MEKKTITIDNKTIPVYSMNTIIVGSGAASLNCADELYSFGQKDIAIVTEKIGGGTSNNTGSDKQTYYKMSVSGKEPDSAYEMSKSLYNGGGMHGDLSLIESTLSTQAFFHLVQVGVQFPHNQLGGFVGYKTDHDPRQRATSAGPYTSQQMFARLYDEINRKEISIFDEHDVIGLLKDGDRVIGVAAIDKSKLNDDNFGLVLFHAQNVVFGVGGPGGIYKTSVYPECHLGAIGLALEIGAEGQNLTESQYGLASIKFRWNVSGTYQQVLPRYISTDQDGNDEQEFLNAYFDDFGLLNTDVFLKGYQWPFDPRKIENKGSSLVDVLVYIETVVKGRRVYMDFRSNPQGDKRLGQFRFEDLSEEAYTYLKNSKALFGTPIERLEHMNPIAIELYKKNGIDLHTEPLEVAVCAQHNNGGLKGDIWWESNIRHLFPVGEVNGSHGVYRPGGSALNSGQVGSIRAAQRIANVYTENEFDFAAFEKSAGDQANAYLQLMQNWATNSNDSSDLPAFRDEFQERMSKAGGHIRELSAVTTALENAYKQMANRDEIQVKNRNDLPFAFQNRQLVLAHAAYLEAVKAYLEADGGSRGSYMVMDPNGLKVLDQLGEEWRYKADVPELGEKVLETVLSEKNTFESRWVARRPIPEDEFWFENVWADYRAGKVFTQK